MGRPCSTVLRSRVVANFRSGVQWSGCFQMTDPRIQPVHQRQGVLHASHDGKFKRVDSEVLGRRRS